MSSSSSSMPDATKMSSPSQRTGSAPALNLDLWAHKWAIALRFAILFISTCALNLGIYFGLTYGTTRSAVPLTTILAIPTPIFGLTSLLSFILRTWRLTRKPIYRPMGSNSGWKLDFFNWNFAFGLVYITIVISVGLALKPVDVRVVALALPLLMFQVCGQLLIVAFLMACGVKAPFRISSIARGDVLRPGVAVIAEDIVAVDGGQGLEFREAWRAHYEHSATFRQLLARLDLLWGVTGVVLGAGLVAVIFAVPDVSVGYGVAWSVPWVWAAIMAVVTIRMSKSTPRYRSMEETGDNVS